MPTVSTDLVVMLRVLTNDLVVGIEVPENTDSHINRVLVTAGILVDNEAALPVAYAFDLGAVTITPDPVALGDKLTMALLSLRGACILTKGQQITATGGAFSVRDGTTAVDTSVSFRGFRDIIERGVCADYETLRKRSGAASGAAGALIGSAVTGPRRDPGDAVFSDLSAFIDDVRGFVDRRSARGLL